MTICFMLRDKATDDVEVLWSDQVWVELANRLQLSPRAVQVARGIVADQTELHIARSLGISPHTVHTHTERLYRKLSVSSRVELAVRLARCRVDLNTEPGSPCPPLCSHHAVGHCPLLR